jgi:KUP system potassium uptake protein
VPDINTGTIVGISCAILVLLFAIQPFGITRLGSAFAPIVILWLVFNASFGIYVCGPNPVFWDAMLTP